MSTFQYRKCLIGNAVIMDLQYLPGVKDAPISFNVEDTSVHCSRVFCRHSIIILNHTSNYV